MKSTGIVRKTDELGRIVIPKSLRDTMGIGSETPLEISVDGNKIIIQKYEGVDKQEILLKLQQAIASKDVELAFALLEEYRS